MKKLKKLLVEETYNMTKIDYLIIGTIILFYSILSFINLGVTNSPQTFYRSGKETQLIFELKKQANINDVRFFSGDQLENIKILISKDNKNYHEIYSNNGISTFEWKKITIDANIKYIKLLFNEYSSIGEIGIFDQFENQVPTNIISKKDTEYLIDESNRIPNEPSFLNSTYFDEVYFARTAYDYKEKLSTYEWTHPPLGKMIQTIPILIFKNFSPFYYRLMGNIAGIMMIYVMYLFGELLFKKRIWAIFSSLLLVFETSHFSHTRMGTSDSYLILFIMLAIYFMIKYLKNDTKKLGNLVLSGLFFGMSISVKWSAFTGGLALAIIYFIDIFKNKRSFTKSCLKGMLCFVIIPVIIYISLYLIYPNNRITYTNNISNIVTHTKEMYEYHHNLNEPHFFSSKYYTWPISYKPVWYYVKYVGEDRRGTISGVGNIMIWWFSLLVIPYAIYRCLKKDKVMLLLLIVILSLYVPHILIGRGMFLYHYYPTIPFLILLITAFFKSLEKHKSTKYISGIYLLTVILFFIIYYPAISGIVVDNAYLDKLRILKTWFF